MLLASILGLAVLSTGWPRRLSRRRKPSRIFGGRWCGGRRDLNAARPWWRSIRALSMAMGMTWCGDRPISFMPLGIRVSSPVAVSIAGSRLEADSILDIINGTRDFEQTDLIIKNTTITYNYKNLLILSQPSQSACVHAIDSALAGTLTFGPAFPPCRRAKFEDREH